MHPALWDVKPLPRFHQGACKPTPSRAFHSLSFSRQEPCHWFPYATSPRKRGMQGYPESSVIDAGLRPGGTLKVFLNGRVWDA